MYELNVIREPRLACLMGACVRRATILVLFVAVAMASPSPANAQASALLFWDPPIQTPDVSYVVEWGPAPGAAVVSATVPRGTTSFEATGLRPGLRYYFTVRAVDAQGRRSGPSNELSVVAPGPPRAATPDVVSLLAAEWPDVMLTVEGASEGGTVASSPAGIDCGTTCAAALPRGTPVTLAASAAPGHRFVGWLGADCSGDGSCTVRLDTATTVRAIFERGDDTAPSSYTRYLAEGAASDFFDTRLVLANPGGRMAHASVQFLREDGVVVPHVAEVAPLSSARIDAGQFAGLAGRSFATIVESDTPLVIDRTMSWHAPGGVAYGSHAETSVAGPAPRWYLAEGATHAGFDLFYLLLNPQERTVSARIRYLRPVGEVLEKIYELPPRSRTSVWVDQEVFGATGAQALNNTEVSAIVETLDGAGIVVERAMYDSRQGTTFAAGHESAGVTAPATRWYFAEGATGPFFDLFLLIANPADHGTDVQVTYLLPDGTRERRLHHVGPSQRYTIWVDQEGGPLADTAVSAIVESVDDTPIVVERSMWWPGDSRTWTEAHNSPGATETGTRWAVADGEVSTDLTATATYLLVANTSEQEARVRVTLLFRPGLPAVSREFPVAAGSRFGVSVADAFPEAAGERCGALIESLGETPAPIVVERAMYADGPGQRWASGTNVLATRLK
ncbi:Fibronectin type III domain protein [Luteitalea pratensis]|uniref:Fibronectin type III domain protein n=1 Tax=Luteitalea pratensis TaxID=1855912 RepID=A0A143PRA7_LUTPR|nr:fibronectin type III domain-containing protein [Luteitalea pratensis]AMY10650.1 Fibronectin type III domain protein [Luteitalea pratensis]